MSKRKAAEKPAVPSAASLKAIDLIGPPSASIDLRTFLIDALAHSHLWKGSGSELQPDLTEAHLLGLPDFQVLQERCSVADLQQEAQAVFDNDGDLADLKQWQWARMFCGSDSEDRLNQALLEGTAPRAKKANPLPEPEQSTGMVKRKVGRPRKKAGTQTEDELFVNGNDSAGSPLANDMDIVIDPDLMGDDTASPVASTSQLPANGASKKPNRRRLVPQKVVEPGLPPSAIPLKNSITAYNLCSFKPIADSINYYKRTRQSDYQSLSHLRTPCPPDVYRHFDDVTAAVQSWLPNSSPAEVLVTIKYHPIGHKVNLGRDSHFVAHRQQHTVFLASQTLADVRDALATGSSVVPDEEELPLNGDEELDEFGVPKKRRRYTTDKWTGGAVICINGRLYGDSRDNHPDYVHALLSELGKGSSQPSQMASPGAQDIVFDGDLDIDPLLDPSILDDDERIFDNSFAYRKSRWTTPEYLTSGRSMLDTSLYDIIGGIRLGQPCWLLQQGDDEHIFTFEEIRLMHPSDPPQIVPDSDAVLYPITTFLSRLNINKCLICEKDPSSRVLVNDELAGVTPCPICDICFKLLHVSEEVARQQGVQFVPMLEEL